MTRTAKNVDDKINITRKIKQKCLKLFDQCGFVKAEKLNSQIDNYLKWIKAGYNDQMSYLERNIDKRLDPTKLVKNVKSIIVVLQNYSPAKQLNKKSKYLISKYAYGLDYHYVIKRKLNLLLEYINNNITEVKGRAFVDSAPVLEKFLALKAGLGWIGKNSLLLTKKGSYFFIGELFINIELQYDRPKIPQWNLCGSCTRCIDACPTKAIIKPGVIDARRCISNLTIERQPPIPDEFKGKYQQWIFGCDICQDVCPWNSRQKPTNEKEFQAPDFLLSMTDIDWEKLTKEQFKKMFKNSPIQRRKYEGLMHNIKFLN